MKFTMFKKGLIVGLVIIFIISSFSATYLWLNLKQSTAKNNVSDPTKEVLGIGEKSLTKEFTFSEPAIDESREYSNVYVNESDFNSINDGWPVLPVNITVIELPFGSEIVNFSFYYSTPEIFTLAKKLSYGSCSSLTAMDKSIYNVLDPYPSDFVSYHTGGGLSDGVHKTFLSIRVYPIKYISWDNQLQFVKNVKIKIIYKEPLKPLLEDNHVYDLLIISPSKFTKLLQPLAEHKDNHDIKTKIVSLDEVYDKGWYGRDKEEKIKYFIKDAIENWGIKYVLLVGGMKGQSLNTWDLPVRYSHVIIRKGTQESIEPAFISDLYYADIYDSEGKFSSWDSNNNDIFAEWDNDNKDEMDLYPDVYLGRLPCRNKIEVKTMVKKIINYEKEECDESWFNKMILITGDHWNDEGHVIEGELITEEAINLMQSFEPVKLYASETTINSKTINNAINAGAGFVYFCGHGGVMVWATHYPPDGTKWTDMYNLKKMNSLKNKEKLPIAVVGGCNNGQFDNSIMKNIKTGIQKYGLRYLIPNPLKPDSLWKNGLYTRCWSWKLTSKVGGGSIATISNTGLGTHAMNDADNNLKNDYVEIYDGWLELRFFQLYGQEHKDILGEDYDDAITDYLNRFLGGNDEMDKKMAQQWELFGDPSLKIGGYK